MCSDGLLCYDEQGLALVVQVMSASSVQGLSWVAGDKPIPGHCIQALPATCRTRKVLNEVIECAECLCLQEGLARLLECQLLHPCAGRECCCLC